MFVIDLAYCGLETLFLILSYRKQLLYVFNYSGYRHCVSAMLDFRLCYIFLFKLSCSSFNKLNYIYGMAVVQHVVARIGHTQEGNSVIKYSITIIIYHRESLNCMENVDFTNSFLRCPILLATA